MALLVVVAADGIEEDLTAAAGIGVADVHGVYPHVA